jgi:hypothetical protein
LSVNNSRWWIACGGEEVSGFASKKPCHNHSKRLRHGAGSHESQKALPLCPLVKLLHHGTQLTTTELEKVRACLAPSLPTITKHMIKVIIHGKVILLKLSTSALSSVKAHPTLLKIQILPLSEIDYPTNF